MKRGFVRTLFGGAGISAGPSWRWARLLQEIEFASLNPFLKDTTVYVLGVENQKLIEGLGFKCRLVHPDPFLYRNDSYRNRLPCLLAAAEDFDEFISLDWECFPDRPLPKDLWERLGQQAPFQAPLAAYRRNYCPWRETNKNLVPCGGFMYFRDRTIPQQFSTLWDELKITTLDEIAIAYWTDQQIGGWQGVDKYWENFEPYCASTWFTRAIYGGSKMKEKRPNIAFAHSHRIWGYAKLLPPERANFFSGGSPGSIPGTGS